MIKINLVKSRVGVNAPADVSINFGSGGASGSQLGIILKLLSMSIFLIAAMYYRSNQVEDAQTAYRQAQTELDSLRSQIEQKRQEANAKPGLEAEAKELNNKLEILRNLSRLRLVEVKSLDFIQTVIPDRVWLQAVDYKRPQFRISGFASSEDDVTSFMKSLEAGPYFKDVILLQSKEQKSNQGSVKAFEVSFRAESQN